VLGNIIVYKHELLPLHKKMAAEAVGFMSRGADGGRAAELVTRDFLGGCAGADDASRDAAVAERPQHDAATVSLLRFFCDLFCWLSCLWTDRRVGLPDLHRLRGMYCFLRINCEK
jgi:hypothetical protein